MPSEWLAVVLGLSCALAAALHVQNASAQTNGLLAPPLAWWDQWLATSKDPIPDFNSLKSSADLPALLRFESGQTVRSSSDWSKRKAEIRRLLCHYIVGTFPKSVPALIKTDLIEEQKLAHARRRLVRLTYATLQPTAKEVSITAELLVPEGKGPFPVFMTQTNHRRVGLIGLARGYLVCIYPGADIDDQTDGFARAYPEADWGRIARRAWLGSRVLDYLVTLPEVDKKNIAITGHSRNGKQSLIAAAFDERITAIVSSSSGTGGSVPFRFVGENAFEESVEFMSRQQGTADWFHPRIRFFTGREDKLPIDVHGYLALIAPRPCLLSAAYNDGVDTTFATERNYLAAREVYQFLGKPENLRIRWRPGGHEWDAHVASAYFDWFDRAAGRGKVAFPETLLHTLDVQAWKSRQPAASLEPPTQGSDPVAAIHWMLGEEPPQAADPGGGHYDGETPHEAVMMNRDGGRPASVVRMPVNFGSYVTGELYYPKAAKAPLPVILWLHPYSYSSGYSGAYMVGPKVYNALAEKGYAVFAFDQLGFGRRVLEGSTFYDEYPRWSKLGKMLADVRAAVDMMTLSAGRSPGHDALTLPPLDHKKIYCLGYSLGGTLALYAAALDERIAGVASFCGFTPMRSDTQSKPTGGLRRFSQWHGLLPKLSLYEGREAALPYDFEDLLARIAPRPCLIVSPVHDRDADLADVQACLKKARAAWLDRDAADKLTHLAPEDYNRFQTPQQEIFEKWLATVAGRGPAQAQEAQQRD